MIEVDPNIKQQQGYRKEIPTTGEALLNKMKELIHEGNVHRIIIKHEGVPSW